MVCNGSWISHSPESDICVCLCVCLFLLSVESLTGSIPLRYQYAYKYVECLRFGWSMPVVDVFVWLLLQFNISTVKMMAGSRGDNGVHNYNADFRGGTDFV